MSPAAIVAIAILLALLVSLFCWRFEAVVEWFARKLPEIKDDAGIRKDVARMENNRDR